MRHFSTIGPQLFYSFPLLEEEIGKINDLMDIFEASGVSKIIDEQVSNNDFGRPGYDPYSLFSIILLAFAIGTPSLREIESSCRFDIRFIFILGENAPDHTTISRFINKVILPRRQEIFGCITKAIFDRCNINMETCFIDGTKQEAKPNKFKYVWKPMTFHKKLCDKTRNLLEQMGLSEDIPSNGIFDSALIAAKLKIADGIDPPPGISDKAYSGMKENLMSYLLKAVEYEEKEEICGPYRNSYYKTDHDATAMCLKEDYYSGLGSNMHAAYSIQALVSRGFVVSCHVSQDRTDLYAFTKTIDLFHSMYNIYPKRICADSGYGCTTNYEYCNRNNIIGFLKYNSWEGEKPGRNPAVYEMGKDGTITCLGQRKGYKATIEGRHPKKKDSHFYLVKGCTGCAFMPYCRRYMKEPVGDEKVFEVDERFMLLKQEARDLLLTTEGIEMRVNRSCQTEGVFGSLKNNMGYSRIRRVSMEKVQAEIMLHCLGYNLRKFIRYCSTGKGIEYWRAPSGLKPSEFRKPSAKRLSNRVNKKRQKSPNEIAKDTHKYKKTMKI